MFQLTDGKKLDHIINLLGYDPRQNPVLHINFGMLEEECCRSAFLRGVFFAGGSITDPAKRYHLELTTSHMQVSRELDVLLRECGYPPKSVSRNGSFVTYFKQSHQIEDFLTLIGAPVAAMNVMTAKMEKDLRNSVNRRLNCDSANLDKAVGAAQEQLEAIRKLEAAMNVMTAKMEKDLRNSVNRRLNCDSANLDKAVGAAQEQLEAIRKLEAAGLLEKQPEKLRQTASLRAANPELTLSELAEEFDPPVTKSCLNHRLRKLVELAKNL